MPLQIRIEDIIDILEKYATPKEIKQVEKAYIFAAQAHAKQYRKDGSYYIIHPLHVAMTLAEMVMDVNTIIAALLHDVLEDTSITDEDLIKNFGKDVHGLVSSVTNIPNVKSKFYDQDYVLKRSNNIKKFINIAPRDVRVIFIKLADRLHNMETLQYMSPEKREVIATETIQVYANLAHIYGLYKIRNLLENLAFEVLYPEESIRINKIIEEYLSNRKGVLEEAREQIIKKLNEKNIEAVVQTRVKHLYGIYEKLRIKGINFARATELHDILGIRIIVNKEEEVYKVLGYVNALWKNIESKDYISNPKPNGYKSYHCTVLAPDNKKMEVQIRTVEMDSFAENGMASHWYYKFKNGQLPADDISRIDEIKRILVDNIGEEEDPLLIRDNIEKAREHFTNNITVYTPKGEIKFLPEGATVLDFAYSIHSDIGNHCTGAIIDGALKRRGYELKNGEIVKINTNKDVRAKSEWLNLAKTKVARNKIKAQTKFQASENFINEGKKVLSTELTKYDISFNKFLTSRELKNYLEVVKIKDVERLLCLIGENKIKVASIHKVIKKLNPDVEIEIKPLPKKKVHKKKDDLEKLKDLKKLNMPYKKCKACNPSENDDILGYVGSNRIITIHKTDCKELRNLSSDKIITLKWEDNQDSKNLRLRINVLTKNEPGILNKITSLTSKMGINIKSVTFKDLRNNESFGSIILERGNLKQYDEFLENLSKIDGIIKIYD